MIVMNSEIAILLAAGLGNRMLPLTKKVPKPLAEVQGVPLIETIISGLQKRNIGRIYIVTGHLGEQFQYLTAKYSNIELIENKEYLKKNNISSLHAVGDILGSANCFICEADLYVADTEIFQQEHESSCYFGKMVEGYSDDWAFIMEGKRIVRIKKGAEDTYNLAGISYWHKNDAKLIKDKIDEAYRQEGHENLFWDEIVDLLLAEMEVQVYEVSEKSVVELDTVEELKELEEKLNGNKLGEMTDDGK